jgi:DNA repair exonuclease SbcCD ATPase subunit
VTTQDMEEIVFGCCGAVVWLTNSFMVEKRKTGDTFYCPNGHARHFKETTAEKLQRELDQKESALADKEAKLAKLKDGKCPFCWKTVKELSGHIKRSHS